MGAFNALAINQQREEGTIAPPPPGHCLAIDERLDRLISKNSCQHGQSLTLPRQTTSKGGEPSPT